MLFKKYTIDVLKEHFEMANVSIIKYNWNKTLKCLNDSAVYYPFIKPKENTLACISQIKLFLPKQDICS